MSRILPTATTSCPAFLILSMYVSDGGVMP
jgi:hypothetical protein